MSGAVPRSKLVLEGFAGPGGWSEGLRMAGYRGPLVGIEIDEAACRTAHAAGHRRVRADVAKFPLGPLRGRVAGLVMSPPCQAWSSAGDRKGELDRPEVVRRIESFAAGHEPGEVEWHDERSSLTAEPMRYAVALRPRWIALEQVEAVLPLWERVAELLTAMGYFSWTGVLRAEEYGVPQTRKRAVLMASLDRHVTRPQPTHLRYPLEADLFGTPRWLSMYDAVGWGMRNRPAWTVTSGGSASGGVEVFGSRDSRKRLAAEMGVPPGRSVPVSVQDAAALQTFPAGYPWFGTVAKRHEQVGNAVPPLLARAVFTSLAVSVEARVA